MLPTVLGLTMVVAMMMVMVVVVGCCIRCLVGSRQDRVVQSSEEAPHSVSADGDNL